jgi:hypothetical protein
MFLLVMVSGGTALAGETVDQEQPEVDDSGPGNNLIGPTDQGIAQLLTAGILARLCAIELPLMCSGNPDDAVRVSLNNAADEKPGDEELAFVEVKIGDLPPPNPGDPFIRIPFPEPPRMDDGVQYSIVIRGIRAAGKVGTSSGAAQPETECTLLSGPAGDSYPGGDAFHNELPNPPDEWICFCDEPGGAFDIPFRTLVEDLTVQIEPTTWGVVKATYR